VVSALAANCGQGSETKVWPHCPVYSLLTTVVLYLLTVANKD